MIKRYIVLFLVTLLLCTGPLGCYRGQPAAYGEKTGSVRILISGPEAYQGGLLTSAASGVLNTAEGGLIQAEVELTNGTTVVSRTVTLENGEAEATFSDIVVGPWTVVVRLMDAEGSVAYQGSCKVAITAGEVAQANVVLQPALGALELTVDLTAIPNHERVSKIRLYKDSNNLRSQKDIHRESGTHIVSEVISGLQPKTYDMMIKLYDENGDVVYESLWTAIHISPGKITTVDWDLSSGGVAIIVDCNAPPSVPLCLTATLFENRVELTWKESTDSDLAVYRIYRRQGPFEGFKVLAEAQHSPGQDQNYVDTGVKPGLTYSYFVTAVDEVGNESPRSNEIAIDVP